MWAYEYLEGLKPLPSYPLQKGTFVHAVVENFNRDPGPFPDSSQKKQQIERVIERLNRIARRLWEEGLPGEFEGEMRKKSQELKDQFKNYAESFLQRFNQLKRRTELSPEKAWQRAAPDANELSVAVTDENGEWLFCGGIDAVYEKHPLWFDRTAIVDYKTGKSPFNSATPLSVDYGRQLDIYGWLYYQAFGQVPEVAGIHFLAAPTNSSTAFVFKEIDPGTVESVHLMLERVRSLTVSENYQDYPPNPQYKWCCFKKKNGQTIRCDHWKYCQGGEALPEPVKQDNGFDDRKLIFVDQRDPLAENLPLSEHASAVFDDSPDPEKF